MKNFIEFYIDGFEFSNEQKCSELPKVEKLINVSTNIFRVGFHQVGIEGKHKLLPIEFIETISDTVVD